MQLLAECLADFSKELRHMAQVWLGRPTLFRWQAPFRRLVTTRSLCHAVCARAYESALHANRLVPQLFVPSHIFQSMVNVFPVRMCVHQHAITTPATQQVVHRRLQCFSLDVPQSNIHSSN